MTQCPSHKVNLSRADENADDTPLVKRCMKCDEKILVEIIGFGGVE